MIVLSGSDNRVHLFVEEATSHAVHEISKQQIDKEFPEFKDPFASVALYVEFFYSDDANGGKRRWTAVGCECGAFYLFCVDLKRSNAAIEKSSRVDLGASVTSCRFFKSGTSIHLVVTTSLLPATVYR